MDEVLKRRLVGGAILVALLIATTLLFFRGGPEPANGAKGPVEVKTYALEVPPPAEALAPAPDTKQVGSIPPAPEEAPRTGEEGAEDADNERPIPSKASAAQPALAAPPVVTTPPPSQPVVTAEAKSETSKPGEPPVTFGQIPSSVKPARTSTAQKSAPSAGGHWAVQTGSFASATNAAKARKQLEARGYPAFVSKSSGARGLYRVRAGPYATEAAARSAASKLRAALKQDVQVVPNG